MANYYHDIWKQRIHIIAPLRVHRSKTVPWKQIKMYGTACAEVLHVTAKETQLNLLDFKEEIQMHTKARKYQLKMQYQCKKTSHGHTVARKEIRQKNYTIGEQELLRIA
jgi:hypothetical protein